MTGVQRLARNSDRNNERNNGMAENRRTPTITIHSTHLIINPHSYLVHLHVHEAWRCNGVRYVCPGRTLTRGKVKEQDRTSSRSRLGFDVFRNLESSSLDI